MDEPIKKYEINKTRIWKFSEPSSEDGREFVVELSLLRVVLECEVHGIAEPQPCDHTHHDYHIAHWTLVDVQHFGRVKCLKQCETNLKHTLKLILQNTVWAYPHLVDKEGCIDDGEDEHKSGYFSRASAGQTSACHLKLGTKSINLVNHQTCW